MAPLFRLFKEEFSVRPALGQVLCFVGMPCGAIHLPLARSATTCMVRRSPWLRVGWCAAAVRKKAGGALSAPGSCQGGSSLRSVTLRFPRHRDAEFLALNLGTELVQAFGAQELAPEAVSGPEIGLGRGAAPCHPHALPLLRLGHGAVPPAAA